MAWCCLGGRGGGSGYDGDMASKADVTAANIHHAPSTRAKKSITEATAEREEAKGKEGGRGDDYDCHRQGSEKEGDVGQRRTVCR